MWTNLSRKNVRETEKTLFSASSMSSSISSFSLKPRAEMSWPALMSLRRVDFCLTITAYWTMWDAVTTSLMSSVKYTLPPMDSRLPFSFN